MDHSVELYDSEPTRLLFHSSLLYYVTRSHIFVYQRDKLVRLHQLKHSLIEIFVKDKRVSGVDRQGSLITFDEESKIQLKLGVGILELCKATEQSMVYLRKGGEIQRVNWQLQKTSIIKTSKTIKLMTANQSSVLIVQERQLVWVCGGDRLELLQDQFTAIQISHDDKIIAANQTGHIFCFDSPRSRPVVHRWHTCAINHLEFDENGFISAGGEGVLVFWRNFGEKKDFLPRQGGQIVWFKKIQDKICMLMADKYARVISLNSDKLNFEVSIVRRIGSNSFSRLDQNKGRLYFSSGHNCIQSIYASSGQHCNFKTTKKIFLSSLDNKVTYPTTISHVDFDFDRQLVVVNLASCMHNTIRLFRIGEVQLVEEWALKVQGEQVSCIKLTADGLITIIDDRLGRWKNSPKPNLISQTVVERHSTAIIIIDQDIFTVHKDRVFKAGEIGPHQLKFQTQCRIKQLEVFQDKQFVLQENRLWVLQNWCRIGHYQSHKTARLSLLSNQLLLWHDQDNSTVLNVFGLKGKVTPLQSMKIPLNFKVLTLANGQIFGVSQNKVLKQVPLVPLPALNKLECEENQEQTHLEETNFDDLYDSHARQNRQHMRVQIQRLMRESYSVNLSLQSLLL